MTFEEYLKHCFENGIIDLSIRMNVNSNNQVTFYIHPSGKNGITKDYIVNENMLMSK
jgi:hypothetical protein